MELRINNMVAEDTAVLPSKGYAKELIRDIDIDIYKYAKKVLDIIISVISIVLLAPVFLIISMIIKMESKGPVFFVHKRIGKNGKELNLYKFRTMFENAEELKNKFTLEQKKEFEKKFKLDKDPRITRVGKFLRRTSLDELPQLLNILKGELSLIGPRPVVEKELEKYRNQKNKFLSITPGLTGYWAANGRSSTTYEQRMKMELHYVDNISLKMDIQIIFRTIVSVLKSEGAV